MNIDKKCNTSNNKENSPPANIELNITPTLIKKIAATQEGNFT